MSLLEVKNLHVEVADRQILNGLNLTVEKGQVAAIMGPGAEVSGAPRCLPQQRPSVARPVRPAVADGSLDDLESQVGVTLGPCELRLDEGERQGELDHLARRVDELLEGVGLVVGADLQHRLGVAFAIGIVALVGLTLFLVTLIGRLANGHMWIGAILTGVFATSTVDAHSSAAPPSPTTGRSPTAVESSACRRISNGNSLVAYSFFFSDCRKA